MAESVNSKKAIKKIRRGLSIYRIGSSPFWHARIYDPVKKKYVVRSTKEANRIEAIEVACEVHRCSVDFLCQGWGLQCSNDNQLVSETV